MSFTVNIWKDATSQSPELSADVEADDPLEAAFALMRRCRLSFASCVLVLGESEDQSTEYTDVLCPGREVC